MTLDPALPQVGARLIDKRFPPVTRTTLAHYCGPSGDLNPMHVDLDFARAAGFEDVFAHGMLVMAWLGQAVTDVIPPERLRAFSTRFVAITHLGDEIACQGEVAEILDRDGERLARLTLTAKNQAGEVKLSGEAIARL